MKSGPVSEAAEQVAETVAASGRSENWELPVPLDRRAELPHFPLDALPNWQAAFVEATAIATQTPVDMAAVFSLGAVAAMIQGRVRVEPVPGWVEELAPFFVVIMQPGERKTAVHRDVLAPVVEYETSLIAEQRSSIAEARALHGVLEKQLDAAKKKAATKRGDAALQQEVRDLARELDELAVPVAPRIFADDVTPEACATLLADHGAISVLSAEGGIFDVMTGRYSNGHPNLDVFLKGHSGDPLRVDRRGRPPEYVERPVLPMCLAVQPFVIEKAAQAADLGQRGLFDRCSYSMPSSRVGHRATEPPPVPPHIQREYRMQMLDLGRSARGASELLTLRASEEARAALRDWRSELEPRRRPDGELGHVQGFASKLDGLAVRLAGLLHVAGTMREGFERPIAGETMRSALRVADYFLAHGVAVFELMGADPAIDGARRLLAWIAKEGRSRFSKRDAHAGNRSVFKRANQLDDALALLERYGWIRSQAPAEPKPQGGRPPSPVFEAHPVALGTEATQDTQPGQRVGIVGSASFVPRHESRLKQAPSLPPGLHGDLHEDLHRTSASAEELRQWASEDRA
jgi:replicative DNA helicase